MKKIYLLFLLTTVSFSTAFGQVEGTWKLAPVAQALAVGPTEGDFGWWSNTEADVTTRACLFDDEYVFNADGSFENVVGDQTWIETWQGAAAEGCATPVAPHDGSAIATWSFDESTSEVTIEGAGAYLGLAKVHNNGELTNPADAVASISYPVAFSNDGMTMTIDINFGGGFWHFVFNKEAAQETGSVDGTWKLAPVAQALAVGPTEGDFGWWSNTEADVTTRACLFDDEYVFNADGSFENVVGDQTWIETWQGAAAEGCATPVAPHDGSAIATWSFDESTSEVTIEGAGAYLGLAKVHNNGELTNPADAVASISYPVAFSNDGMTMTIDINFGGGFWHFVFNKEADQGSVKTVDRNLFNVYPNPATNEINVTSDERLTNVTILDITGKIVYTSSEITSNQTVNVSSLNRGIYMVQVMTDNKTSVKRLILD